MVERYLGCVPVEVDPREANEIYFEESHASCIKEEGISGILNAVYEINNKDHMPLSLFVELTGYCNFSCPFCYINEENYHHSMIPRFPEFKKTLDFFVEAGLVYCTITGGECLLHPDFEEIYRYLKESGVLVTVFTNGYLLTDRIVDLFKAYKPFKVEISLYGHNDASYAAATNTVDVEADKIYECILKLKSSGINVVCKTPITKLTEDSYPIIQRWCEENGIPYYTGADLMDTYSGTSRKEYLASESLIEELRNKSNQAFWADEEMMRIAYAEKKRRICFDCSAGRYDIMIDSHGMLLPCMKAAWVEEWKFDLPKLGAKTAYEMMVDKIMQEKGKPLQYCTGCPHNQICQECFMTKYEHEDLRQHRQDYCRTLAEFMRQK